MEMLTAVVQLMIGVAGTWVGAEMLVRGSSRIALHLGVRPMVVGMTIVAFGTSAPEAVASLTAARMGSPGLALGNVLGSNIANIGLILGLLGLLRPIAVPWERIKGEILLLVGMTALATGLALYQRGFQIWDGWILLAALGFILYHYALDARRNRQEVLLARPPAVEGDEDPRFLLSTVLAVGGLILLIAGAAILVRGARSAAGLLGVPEDIIGATMVAVGTSLPELAASVVALLRGEQEIGVGNILGSNIFNLLFVLGLTVVAGGGSIPYNVSTTGLLLGVMWLFTLAVIPLLRRHGRLERPEAALLLVGYLVFSVLVYFR